MFRPVVFNGNVHLLNDTWNHWHTIIVCCCCEKPTASRFFRHRRHTEDQWCRRFRGLLAVIRYATCGGKPFALRWAAVPVVGGPGLAVGTAACVQAPLHRSHAPHTHGLVECVPFVLQWSQVEICNTTIYRYRPGATTKHSHGMGGTDREAYTCEHYTTYINKHNTILMHIVA